MAESTEVVVRRFTRVIDVSLQIQGLVKVYVRICFTNVFFLYFLFFSVHHKIPDNRFRKRMNGFS